MQVGPALITWLFDLLLKRFGKPTLLQHSAARTGFVLLASLHDKRTNRTNVVPQGRSNLDVLHDPQRSCASYPGRFIPGRARALK